MKADLNCEDSVILAGSGRSGTSWLGAILNSYEMSEYFYEITAFEDLDFGQSDLIRIKYPLTHAWRARPDWVARAERKLLTLRSQWGPDRESAQRSLRIFADHRFQKTRPNVCLYKIVTLFGFAQRCGDLAKTFGDRLKVVHLIRNPYAQIASELRIDARDPEGSRRHFRSRVEQILASPSLDRYQDAARRSLGRGWVSQMALVWRVSNELLEADQDLHKRQVVYEELCESPEEVTADLFSFLGWPVSGQTRDFLRQTTDVSVSDSGNFSLRKNATESMSRWRRELGEEVYAEAGEMLGDSNLLRLWGQDDLSLRQ